MPMAGHTMYSTPPKFISQDPGLSYDIAMGIPPQDAAPVFHFRKRFGNIDWRKMASIDVDKVARELDFVTLQENISTVTFCNIDAVSDLDPLFAKLFKLSQFTVEYLLHSQEYLQSVIQGLEGKVEAQNEDHEKTKKLLEDSKAEVTKLRQENKRRRKMIEQQQMLIESGASSYYKCPHCEKAFMNASFLQGHMQRRHPGSVNYIGDVIAHSQREQSKLAGRLQDLDSDLQNERTIFNEKLRKAEEEKAAWAAQSKREMNRWKKNEEAKWRKELEDMKKNFLEEISQLHSQEETHKNTINTLKMKMEDRQSNLGDLMDGIENDRERSRAYESKIQALEEANDDKQQKLNDLERQLQMMNAENQEAFLKHQERMKRDYASQIKVVTKKPVAKPSSALVREPVPDFDSVDTRMSSFRRKKEDIKRQLEGPLKKMLNERIQQCGIDPLFSNAMEPGTQSSKNAPGISTSMLTNKLMFLKKERQQKAKSVENFFQIRADLRSKVNEECKRLGGNAFPRKRRAMSQQSSQGQSETLPRATAAKKSNVARKHLTMPTTARSSTTYYATTARSTEDASQHVPTPRTRVKKEEKPLSRKELDDDSPWHSDISEIDSPPEINQAARKQYQKTPHPAKGLPRPHIPTSSSPAVDLENSDIDDIMQSDDELTTTKPKSKDEVDGVSVSNAKAQIQAQMQNRTLKKPPAGAVNLFPDNTVKKFDEDNFDEDSFAVSSLAESPKPAPRHAQGGTQSISSNTYGTSMWGSGQPGAKGATQTSKEMDLQDLSDWDDDI